MQVANLGHAKLGDFLSKLWFPIPMVQQRNVYIGISKPPGARAETKFKVSRSPSKGDLP